ncbi:integrase core domain-containing protein [Patulibacter sp. NPDC049589]|uniref:integrase core domain-containing protein n=1 Tax=Patulibacter sp. NPDC049589 TaxID=3154731 RepID=UPI003426D3A9
MTDYGPGFKSDAFARFTDNRPELTHIRTRKKSPEANSVIERYHGAIKIECLWRQLTADGEEMTDQVEAFRRLYDEVRPHEALAGRPSMPRICIVERPGANGPGVTVAHWAHLRLEVAATEG